MCPWAASSARTRFKLGLSSICGSTFAGSGFSPAWAAFLAALALASFFSPSRNASRRLRSFLLFLALAALRALPTGARILESSTLSLASASFFAWAAASFARSFSSAALRLASALAFAPSSQLAATRASFFAAASPSFAFCAASFCAFALAPGPRGSSASPPLPPFLAISRSFAVCFEVKLALAFESNLARLRFELALEPVLMSNRVCCLETLSLAVSCFCSS
mmetsp:Transcript_7507/g.14856  ORF Transcript_7507/g.14856 Transcript_7507/m.14856 type:complete len:223 (-) Transcript_7507:500-1168(-)